MDQNALHQVNETLAQIAILLEDVLPMLLEPATSREAAVSRSKLVIKLLEAIRGKAAKIEKLLVFGP